MTNQKVPEDPKMINLQYPKERNYWSQRFSVSIPELEKAVDVVGHSVAKVKNYLKSKNSKIKMTNSEFAKDGNDYSPSIYK
ncbi:MAG: DUF3606 domain-containing protein [Myxococcota bacterium]